MRPEWNGINNAVFYLDDNHAEQEGDDAVTENVVAQCRNCAVDCNGDQQKEGGDEREIGIHTSGQPSEPIHPPC